MTVLEAPIALMVVSVWTGLGATVVVACLVLLGSGVKVTSMSASLTPATLRAAWTAYSLPMTICVSAAMPSLVRTFPAPWPLCPARGLGEQVQDYVTHFKAKRSFSYVQKTTSLV